MEVASLGALLEYILHQAHLSENCWNKIMVISMREIGKMQAFNIQESQHDITYLFIYLEATVFVMSRALKRLILGSGNMFTW